MLFKISALPTLAAILISSTSLAANEISVFGRYEFRTDPQSQEMLGGLVCFYPAAENSALVRSPDNMPVNWFCFKNESASKKMLNIPVDTQGKNCGVSGHANVRISDYAAYKGEGDGFNTVILLSVTKQSAQKNLPCK